MKPTENTKTRHHTPIALTLLLILLLTSFLSGCRTSPYPPEHSMMNMPCHQMPDGSWMGDCETDTNKQNEQTASTADNDDDPETAKGPAFIDVSDGDEITIIATTVQKTINGRTYTMYAYNGHIPGVILRGSKGDRITVNFHNELNEETTIHWHGLRHDIKDDGVPGISQAPVTSGQMFTYTVYFPDEGLYWYHPHIREDRQQDLGLAGIMLVNPTDADYYNRADQEEILVLDDFLSNQAHGANHATHALMGRFGDTILINGDTTYDFTVQSEEVIRLYLANVANVRPFNFAIPGARIKLVGSDLGLYESESMVDSVIISPAERYIIEVMFEKPGTYHMKHVTPDYEHLLGTITVDAGEGTDNSFSKLRTSTRTSEELRAFAPYFDIEPDYTLDLTIDMGQLGHMMNTMPCHQMGDGSWMGDCDEELLLDEHDGVEDTTLHRIEWDDHMQMMNTMATSNNIQWKIQDSTTKEANMDLEMHATIGEPLKIRLFNDPDSDHPMQHPIHLHGQRFVITHINDEPVQNKVWKDTVLVLPGDTVDILVDVTNPGQWMMHCHIAEHLEAGMMTSVTVT